MATLLMLEANGELHRYDPNLQHVQQETRRVFVFPRARVWFQDALPMLASTWNIYETPAEQVDSMLALFCAGEPIAIGARMKPLNHLGAGVWELKTADVRLFGWFPMKDCFVVTDGVLAQQVKGPPSLYRPFAEQAVRFRDRLNLDEPKYLVGEDPIDVVSDFYYS